MSPHPARTILLIALLILAPLCGCSTFERDWKSAGLAAQPDALAAAAPDVEGRWKGIWVSTANSHCGGLRCLVTADETGALTARYHATYGGILTFEYEMPMTVRRDGDVLGFSAEADLGWLAGGVYESEGSIVGDEFQSTYSCKWDRGVFRMRRVE